MASLFWELFFVGGSTIVQAGLIVGMSILYPVVVICIGKLNARF